MAKKKEDVMEMEMEMEMEAEISTKEPLIRQQTDSESLENLVGDDNIGQVDVVVQESVADLVQARDEMRDSAHTVPAPPEREVDQARVFLSLFGIKVDDKTDEEVIALIDQIQSVKEETAQVLSRGHVIGGIERVLSLVPRGFKGTLFREEPESISDAKIYGYEVFHHESAKVESSTGTSDGIVRYGDCILMIIPEAQYVANQLVRQKRVRKRRQARHLGPVDQVDIDPRFPLIQM